MRTSSKQDSLHLGRCGYYRHFILCLHRTIGTSRGARNKRHFPRQDIIQIRTAMKRKNMTKFDKAVSAAFTGHRFYNFSQQEVIRERLTKAILEAYEHGISNFISGFAIGIDLMAAQIVQSLKPSCPGMTLTAAIPFRGQADRFKPGDRIVYDD